MNPCRRSLGRCLGRDPDELHVAVKVRRCDRVESCQRMQGRGDRDEVMLRPADCLQLGTERLLGRQNSDLSLSTFEQFSGRSGASTMSLTLTDG